MDKLLDLKANCHCCKGFCCRALFFFKSDGFPYDKAAGKDCKHLLSDYHCQIHQSLKDKQYFGCTNYDCLGAGQKTALYDEEKQILFSIFEIMEQLHEMLWYLYTAMTLIQDKSLTKQLEQNYKLIEPLTHLKTKEILALDLNYYRQLINPLLQKTYQQVNSGVSMTFLKPRKIVMKRADFMGCSLHGKDLSGQDFKGAFLIGANLSNCNLSGVNFLGSDVRNMDIRNSDLSKSLFLTPAQINACIINEQTKLPKYLKLY